MQGFRSVRDIQRHLMRFNGVHRAAALEKCNTNCAKALQHPGGEYLLNACRIVFRRAILTLFQG